jgi:hypothetical protein
MHDLICDLNHKPSPSILPARRFPPPWSVEALRPLDLVGAIRNARLLPWSLHPDDSPGTVSSAHLHRAHRAKGNDDGQDPRIGLRAGGCRDHAQGQARHATGAATPRSGNRDHASATAPGRAGAAISAMNSRRFPALDRRRTRRLLCRARPRRPAARLCLFRGRAGAKIGGEVAHAG